MNIDSIFTFLSNHYIWFLVAAAVFFFALVGLIIESAKKRKKKDSDTIEEATPVEAFRHEHTSGNVSAADVVPTVEEAAPVEEPTPVEVPVTPVETQVSASSVAQEAPVVTTNANPQVVTPLPVEAPVIENVEGIKQPEPIEDNTFTQQPAPVMDASPVFENVSTPSENVLPEPTVVEPINTGVSN